MASNSSMLKSRKDFLANLELTLKTAAASLLSGNFSCMVLNAVSREVGSVASAAIPIAWPPFLLISSTISL